jgi:arylformamidase
MKLVDFEQPHYSRFEGEVEGTLGSIKGTASFWLKEVEGQTFIEYEGQGLITGSLAKLDSRFAEGLARNLANQGLAKLNKQLQNQEGDMTKIVDLSVPIGTGTLSPPSVNAKLELTSYHRGPGFWQASKVEMLLHTGSHVDFTRHVQQDGETAADVPLDRVCGEALVVDLSFVAANHEITVADLEAHAPEIRPGDIVLVRTDWTEKHWGDFPTYYMESPYCSAEAAQWLVDRGAKAIAFDCFSEYCARLPDFGSEDFIIHKVILENGAILMQQLTNFSQLPAEGRFRFFAPFLKIEGAEGAPARFFALLD